MNVWDILILILLVGAVALAMRKLHRKRGGCSCGCEGCRAKDTCRASEERERKS